MVDFHNTLGTLVIVAYLALTVANVIRLRGGDFAWARYLSFLAAGLLLLQYVLGFTLLSEGFRNQSSHYLFALLPIITLGIEHGYAPTRDTPRARAAAALIATTLTLILVIIAYSVGLDGS